MRALRASFEDVLERDRRELVWRVLVAALGALWFLGVYLLILGTI